MTQEAEALIERQRLRRRLMLWRLLFVGALALAFARWRGPDAVPQATQADIDLVAEARADSPPTE